MQKMRQQLDQGMSWVQHQGTPDDHTIATLETKIDTKNNLQPDSKQTLQ